MDQVAQRRNRLIGIEHFGHCNGLVGLRYCSWRKCGVAADCSHSAGCKNASLRHLSGNENLFAVIGDGGDDDPAIADTLRSRQFLHDSTKRHGRNGEIISRLLRGTESPTQALVNCWIVVVAAFVSQQSTQSFECGRVQSAGSNPPCFSTLSLARALNRSRLQSSRATPTTGTLSVPRFTMACSAGKIFLYARSPVAPKNTNVSEWGMFMLV